MSAFMEYFHRHPIMLTLTGLTAVIIASMSITVVPETQQGLILSYGQIQRTVNPWHPRQRFGHTGAGLVLRIPFIEQIELIDKRMMGVSLDNQPVPSTDQLTMQVDAYARFRIVNAERMYETVRTEQGVTDQMRSLLSTTLRNELGRRTFATLLSPERGQVMANIHRSLSEESARYGVQVVDVRINRADLPEASRESVFDRMRSARSTAAATILAEGAKQARLIQGAADADAARIYAESYGKDPQFYAFYRAMQSYRSTFLADPAAPTTFILPPGEGYLSEFGNR